ncbi:MAG: TIGR02453 family protein [Microbacterium sp. 14-71-5]|jgi:uncharacterized protein (TIGR02453 family)|uniref:DUF2461 domain-containing protein n=1 Tax=Microbacterium sp. 13-71-7 TaxID=1970399 RepID=UPI000BD50C3E|nr:DUF2461 domain-containing protein [Microbacterium sp. 13-71-7]OZB86185.1 MAG: TIGR02453 family protein [Microbacterium sp. 13-71-7]OZB89901.1 MAG: TIGR02453 family protein [Microbacterium sp. 14-71-5]
MFPGWSERASAFYVGLEADNTKDYWTRNRAVYDAEVLAPMQALLDDLSAEFGEGRIFRPNRDIRFSADKSPYKTSIGAMLGQGYVEFSARGLGTGAGCHMLAADQLTRLRSAVADDETGPRLEAIIGSLEASGIDVTSHDRLATAPRGYPKDHPRIELLRNKDLVARKHWDPTTPWLHSPEAADHVVAVLRAARPLVRWLDENVGPTAREGRR